MIMTTPRGFQMTDARLVSLVIAGPDGPSRVDIAVQSHPLDAEDPMRRRLRRLRCSASDS
jgi:hypothetical protein